MDEDQIKVSYIPRAYLKTESPIHYRSKAYVSEKTLIGEDKWSGSDVHLKWSDEHDTYIQID